MNWSLLPSRIAQIIDLEIRSWRTPGCGIAYAGAKWNAVIFNKRKIKFLGRPLLYEDRLNPFSIFTYVEEIDRLLRVCRCSLAQPLRILEVGANIGIWGRALLDRLPEARLYSFEPNRDAFNILEANRRDFPNWRTFNFGVGETASVRPLYFVPGKSGQGSLQRANADLNLFAGGGRIESSECLFKPLTIDFCNDSCHGHAFDIIKIDVEGAEAEVIRGLGNIVWGCMYIELSIERAGAIGLDAFISLIRSYWPSAEIAHMRPLSPDITELYLTCNR